MSYYYFTDDGKISILELNPICEDGLLHRYDFFVHKDGIKSDFEYICDCGEIRVSKSGLNSDIGFIHYLLLKPEKFQELFHESLKRKNGLVAKL